MSFFHRAARTISAALQASRMPYLEALADHAMIVNRFNPAMCPAVACRPDRVLEKGRLGS
jgi:hypothetical protein